MNGYVTTDFERGMDVGRQVVAVQLKAENEKLRELVQELWPLAYWYTPDLSELDKAKDLMRELGIGVDE